MVTYRYAEINDVDLLVSLRLKFLKLVPSDSCYNELKTNIEIYFNETISRRECSVILAEDEFNIIGTGIIFYYDSVPSVSNIVGKNAYITSMYVHEQYRRQKIGSEILTRLIKIAKEKNCQAVMLNATEIGKKLYQRHGFVDIESGMIYKSL